MRSESRPLSRTRSRDSKMSCCWLLCVVRQLMYRSRSGKKPTKEHPCAVHAVAQNFSCLHLRGSPFASSVTRVSVVFVFCHGRTEKIILGQGCRWQQEDRNLARHSSQEDSKSIRDDSSGSAPPEDRNQCACRGVCLSSDRLWQIYMESSSGDRACQICHDCVCSVHITVKASFGQYHTSEQIPREIFGQRTKIRMKSCTRSRWPLCVETVSTAA